MSVRPELVLVPHVGIALLSWAQIVLSLNRYRGISRVTRAEGVGLLVYLVSAFVRWIGSLAVAQSTFAVQATAATLGSVMAFASFVIVFNDSIRLPTPQQANSLVLGVVTAGLWEVVARLVSQLPP